MITCVTIARSMARFIMAPKGIIEKIFSHYKSSQTISQGVNAVPWLCCAMCIRPDYIEPRVDVGDDKSVEGRMCQRKGCKIVCVCDLCHFLLDRQLRVQIIESHLFNDVF